VQGFGFHTLAFADRGFGRSAAGVTAALADSGDHRRADRGTIGKTGFGVVDDANPTFRLLANIGFALVMFIVGTHVPVRDPAVRSGAPRALARAVLVGAVAAALGVGVAAVFGTGHAALNSVLIASSSAALALPAIDSLGLQGPQVLSVTVQIAIADASCIVLLPLVIDLPRAPTVARVLE
jgi:Kef-type K+ transport system membrane component KefB